MDVATLFGSLQVMTLNPSPLNIPVRGGGHAFSVNYSRFKISANAVNILDRKYKNKCIIDLSVYLHRNCFFWSGCHTTNISSL